MVTSDQQGWLNVFESGGERGAKYLVTKDTPPWLGPTGQKIFEKLISQIGKTHSKFNNYFPVILTCLKIKASNTLVNLLETSFILKGYINALCTKTTQKHILIKYVVNVLTKQTQKGKIFTS